MSLQPKSYSEAVTRQTGYNERRKAKLALKSPSKRSGWKSPQGASKGLQRSGIAKKQGSSGKSRKRLVAHRPSSAKTVDGAGSRAIKNECDMLVRWILKLRDHSCITATCSATENLHVSHYVKRGVLALRWDLQNCNLSCDPCNAKHNIDQAPYRHAMVMWYGEKRVQELDRVARENPRLEYIDLLAIRDGLRKTYEAAHK